jgi:hypothetical protein
VNDRLPVISPCVRDRPRTEPGAETVLVVDLRLRRRRSKLPGVYSVYHADAWPKAAGLPGARDALARQPPEWPTRA